MAGGSDILEKGGDCGYQGSIEIGVRGMRDGDGGRWAVRLEIRSHTTSPAASMCEAMPHAIAQWVLRNGLRMRPNRLVEVDGKGCCGAADRATMLNLGCVSGQVRQGAAGMGVCAPAL